MTGRRSLLALLAIVLIVGCSPDTPTPTPAASTALADVDPSPSSDPAATSSPLPSPSATPSAAPTATPLPTATPIPTPAPTPVPWKSYTSKRFHYKMKYPPDWVVTPGSAKLSDEYDGYVAPYVYVFRDTVSGTASVSLTVSRDTAYYKSHYRAKLLSNKSIKLDGWSGRILMFKGRHDGRTILFQHIILAKGHVGYFIDMEGDYETATPDKATFKAIYKTWRST